jgi:hypothetical protein
MDLRIRRIIRPFARVMALLLDRMNASIKFLLAASIIIAFLGAFSFYRFHSNPWSTDLGAAVIMFVFLSGLVDEITRQFVTLKRKKLSELDKVGLGIDRYTDIILILAALYYLRSFDINIWNFRLRMEDHLGIGAALFIGIYLMGYVSKNKTDTPGWETRAERMFYLSAFMTAGYTHDQFPLYLMVGIFTLGVILYTVSIYGAIKSYNQTRNLGYSLWRISRPIKYFLLEIFWGISKGISYVYHLILRMYKVREALVEVEAQEPVERDYPVQGNNFTALVTDESSSQPVVNATVTLKNKETGKILSSTTNSSGKSNFSGVVEGQYVITVRANGYKTEEFERFLSMDSGEVFALSRDASDLSVIVTDADTNMPIGGSEVILKCGGDEQRSHTDNLGVAYFKELALGIYDVHVKASEYRDTTDKIDLTNENLKSIQLKRAAATISLDTTERPEDYTVAATASRGKTAFFAEDINGEIAHVKVDKRPKIAQVLGESAIVIYNSNSKLEKCIMDIVDECLTNDREVFIVSTQPRTDIYRDKLRPLIDSGMVRVINLSPRVSQPAVNEIPMTQLGAFKSIFEEMPAGSVLIFEALSGLIINEGGVVAYKFVADTIQHFSAEGLCLVCLLDSDAHEKNEISSFENLFINLVRLEGDKFILVR